jgi:hypothetical protein
MATGAAEPVRTPSSPQAPVGRSAVGQSELSHQSNFVKSAPALDDLVVFDPEHLYAFEDYYFAGGRHAHQIAAVSAARGEALNDDVSLGDELLHFAVPIGERLAKHDGRLPHALWPVRSAWERWVVVDEPWVQVSFDGVQVPLREQLLDERVDKLLVSGGSIGCHSQIVKPITGLCHPTKLGFRRTSRGSTLLS